MGGDCEGSRPSDGAAHFVSVVLREGHAQTIVHRTEHNGVGDGLHQERLTRRQGQQHTRGQHHEENHGDDDIEVHFISYVRQFLQAFG